MGDDNKVDDEEIERLEELRRRGNRCHGDDEDVYYTLPPPRSRTGLLHRWMSWRTEINNMMCHAATDFSSSNKMKRERDLLTSPTDTKTPEFLQGEMSIHGQRLKYQYGSHVLAEEDEFATRHENNLLEGNFYLFGIPRASLRRGLEKHGESHDSCTNRQRNSENGSKTSVPEVGRGRRQSGTYFFTDRQRSKGLARSLSFSVENPRSAYYSRAYSQVDVRNSHIFKREED